MAQEPAFQQLQRAFAAHIRNPEQAPRPAEVPERRMRVYRELIFRTIDGLVAKSGHAPCHVLTVPAGHVGNGEAELRRHDSAVSSARTPTDPIRLDDQRP